MKKKEEIKYLENEWKEMNNCLKAFSATGNQEDLHKLRVHIKKVRAMLFLFKGTAGHNSLLKNFKPVRKIFKHAGDIRNAHVNLLLSEQYAIKNEVFETGQQKIIEDGTSVFRHKAKAYGKAVKHSFKKVKKHLPHVNNHAIKAYYKKYLDEIAAGMAIASFTEDMHQNRKLIKILMYNHKLADKALDGALHFNIDYLDKLQDTIGQWHDNVIAAELFSSPLVNDKPVASKIKKINTRVRRNIKVLADDFLRKATTLAVAK
jgi:CHAD domain-containing protein